MKPTTLPRLVSLLALAVICVTMVSEDARAQEIDPQAVEIATRAVEFLGDQPRISVNWFSSYDEIIDGREKITRTISGRSLLQRGEGFYSYLDTGTSEREFFFDGADFQYYNVDSDAYSEVPFAGTFEELVDRIRTEYGVPLPIWELLSRNGTEAFLDDITAAAYLGETRIAGRPVHHLAFSQYDQDWQVWISTDPDRPVIESLVGTDPYSQGWPQYRAYLQNWDFVSEIDPAVFTFEPGEDTIRMTMPKAGDDNE